jgi:hypothetical protein
VAVHRPQPAHVAWGLILGQAAAVDIWLLRKGHLPLSTVCRRSWTGRLAVAVLAAHLALHVRHDPFSWLGGKIAPDKT